MSYDLDALNNLSDEERKIALQILEQFSKEGSSNIYNNLIYEDYDEIPVDIETFLHDPRYLGKGLTNEEGKFTVFPYWVNILKKIFPDNLTTKYNTVILTGPIGIGKSFEAVLIMLYQLHRMLCLKDPYLYYGLQPIDKITFSMLNITLDAAQGVAWDKCQQLVQNSEWFMSKGFINKSKVNPIWQPSKRIELIFGSSNNHVIGRALFSNFTDEVNFGIGNNIEKLKAKQKKLISQIDARMQSRFMKGTYLPTINIIASSKQSEQAFLETYINMKKKNESKTTLIVDEPQWVIRDDKGTPNDPGSFYVAIGNKFLASELLPITATEEEADLYRRKGYILLKVPPGYRETFEDNIDIALTDVAGIATSNSMKYISGVRLNETKIDNYKNPFTKDVIEVGNAPDDTTQYSQYFDLESIPSNLKSKPLFIHLDMSLSGDKTGIAGTWIIGKRPTKAEGDASKELIYRLAFSVSIKAPRGYQVSFEKNRTFIRWLRQQGFNIKGVSSDTYQSAQIQQQLKADGFNTEIISVDRVDSQSKICIPYNYLKSAIYERRVEIYQKCDLLTDELIGLERDSSGHIDHTPDGINSKDQADAFCGSLYLASQSADKYSFDYGEAIETMLDVSNTSSEQSKREQIKVALEEELQNFFSPKFNNPKKEEQKEENTKPTTKPTTPFKDFGLGPAEVYKPSYLRDGIIYW